MTAATLAAMRERATQPIRIDHSRQKLSKDLIAARADVLALVQELERMRAIDERSWQP
jgi:hypothetical protein